MSDVRTAASAARWAEALSAWDIPQQIVDAAPEGPPGRFPPAIFAWTPERAAAEGPIQTPSRRRALEALGEAGTVLDVGAGGGRASLPLAPPATRIVAADPSAELLAAFADAAEREEIPYRTVEGHWPEVAADVEPEDVVVCHNVFYIVRDLVPFVQALTDHARRRVVIELTVEHPASNLNEAWRVLHGIERPTSPTADDAIVVLQEMGLDVEWEEFDRRLPPAGRNRAEVVAFARRRLCVGPEHDAEIEAILGPDLERPVRRAVTVWWNGRAGG